MFYFWKLLGGGVCFLFGLDLRMFAARERESRNQSVIRLKINTFKNNLHLTSFVRNFIYSPTFPLDEFHRVSRDPMIICHLVTGKGFR